MGVSAFIILYNEIFKSNRALEKITMKFACNEAIS